jgi:hypothetical protein
MVAKGDFITLEGDKVYQVKDVYTDGIVRCVSPANAVNESIIITLAEANKCLSRQRR